MKKMDHDYNYVVSSLCQSRQASVPSIQYLEHTERSIITFALPRYAALASARVRRRPLASAGVCDAKLQMQRKYRAQGSRRLVLRGALCRAARPVFSRCHIGFITVALFSLDYTEKFDKMIMDEQFLITTSGQKENLRRSIGFWVFFVLPKRTIF